MRVKESREGGMEEEERDGREEAEGRMHEGMQGSHRRD
jgi:hypothetical protein